MTDCDWLKPMLVGQLEFVNGTEDMHRRTAKLNARGGYEVEGCPVRVT